MPNGNPGDHPLTDILVHGARVYSELIDSLIQEIADLGGSDLIARTLLHDFNDFGNPDLVELERSLTEVRNRLLTDAKERGRER